MKAPVSQILTEGGRVTGVRVGTKENSQVDIYAPIVISDAGKLLIIRLDIQTGRHDNNIIDL